MIYKFLWLLQLSFFQPLYFTIHKVVLWLMNYWIWWEENGEKWFLKLLSKYLKRNKINPVIFDVWANIGQYANHLSTYLSSIPKTIYCFEPMKLTYDTLNQNISNHEIITKNIWLWDSEESINLFYDVNNWVDSCASIFKDNITDFVNKNNNFETINITTLDAFCKENNIQHIHFLKIDIEWSEMKCIQWSREMIGWWHIDIIQIEHNRCAIAAKVFLKDYWDLLSDKYDFYRQLSRNHGLYHIKNYDIYLENFTYINYILVKKDIKII
jgi:FkbM family methyltransferase